MIISSLLISKRRTATYLRKRRDARIIVSDTATAEGQPVYNQITDLSRETKCVHFQVCTIHRQIHRAISVDFNNVKPPFEIIEVGSKDMRTTTPERLAYN